MFEGMRDIQIWDVLCQRWKLEGEERKVLLEALTECERSVVRDMKEKGSENTLRSAVRLSGALDH